MTTLTMNRDDSALVLVDYQERLMPAIHGGDAVLKASTMLARSARLLDVPVVITEHAAERLGPTLPALIPLHEHLLSKTRFDACADGLIDMLAATLPQRRQFVVAGCEAHVCLLQTALSLLQAGKQVFVVSNACGTREPGNHALAMQRLAGAGAIIVSHEMVAFEWLHDSRHPRFRDVLALIK